MHPAAPAGEVGRLAAAFAVTAVVAPDGVAGEGEAADSAPLIAVAEPPLVPPDGGGVVAARSHRRGGRRRARAPHVRIDRRTERRRAVPRRRVGQPGRHGVGLPVGHPADADPVRAEASEPHRQSAQPHRRNRAAAVRALRRPVGRAAPQVRRPGGARRRPPPRDRPPHAQPGDAADAARRRRPRRRSRPGALRLVGDRPPAGGAPGGVRGPLRRSRPAGLRPDRGLRRHRGGERARCPGRAAPARFRRPAPGRRRRPHPPARRGRRRSRRAGRDRRADRLGHDRLRRRRPGRFRRRRRRLAVHR